MLLCWWSELKQGEAMPRWSKDCTITHGLAPASGCGPGVVRVHAGYIEWLAPSRQMGSSWSDEQAYQQVAGWRKDLTCAGHVWRRLGPLLSLDAAAPHWPTTTGRRTLCGDGIQLPGSLFPCSLAVMNGLGLTIVTGTFVHHSAISLTKP
jgi:hypothetical protein